MSFPGPDVLGRGVVIRPGQPVPWQGVPVVTIDRATLQRPEKALAVLHPAWVERRRVVVILDVPEETLRDPERVTEAPYRLGPRFDLSRERLAFLVWANSYDALDGAPTWRLARHAVAHLGAAPSPGMDVRLPDGRDAWIDGGPRQPLDLPVVHGESVALRLLALAPASVPPEDDLAEDQLRAVAHPGGPARILAPAGSGKTRVLASRLRHLLKDRAYEPECVTAVAYNKRAAEELRARTRDCAPRVLTLHALGWDILRQQSPRLRIADEREVRSALRSLVRVEAQRGRDVLAPWLEALAEVRLGLRSPEAVERRRSDVPGFARLFDRYRGRLWDAGLVDFDEQIYAAIEHLLANPEVRRVVQRQCRHLLVDEFQDLTPSYMLLVRLLASPGGQVFGVGDDDQVIYGYVGASPEFLVDFQQWFPAARTYALEVNYRCPEPIVEAAATLLKHNRKRVDKQTRSGAPDSDDALRTVLAHRGDHAREAADAVAGWLEQGARPEDVAVLCRVNEALLPVQVALREAGIPCSTPLDESLLEHSGTRAALAWLRAAVTADPVPSAVLQETLARPVRRIRRVTMDRLRERPSWTASQLRHLAGSLERWESELLEGWLDDLRRVRSAAGRGVADALRTLRSHVGLGRDLEELDASHLSPGASTHADELSALEQLAGLHPAVLGFEDWLRGHLGRRAATRGVTLSSVHRVKGMEWDFVLVYGATDGLMPHRLAEDVEEERRVFHVAITRARRQALVLADRDRPSPFVVEMAGRKAAPRPKGDRLVAELGLRLEHGGIAGTITELREEHAVLSLPTGSTMRVKYGVWITVQGRRVLLSRGGFD